MSQPTIKASSLFWASCNQNHAGDTDYAGGGLRGIGLLHEREKICSLEI